ncbi:MAG TPA: SpoIIE family protein phosphatase [Thermoanaerobaculia bacterium]|nr:SpoIIE family protein phosphatase [Thermoanaerobaculia bacterium]
MITVRTFFKRLGIVLAVLAVLVALGVTAAKPVSTLAWVLFGLTLTAGLVTLAVIAYRAFLWKVGRRLAFSHFLIGVVPVPMALILALGACYVLASFFLGYVSRSTLASLEVSAIEQAKARLAAFEAEGQPSQPTRSGFSFDYYRAGKRVGGAGLAPETWPVWLTAPLPENSFGSPFKLARYVRGADGKPTVAVAVETGELGVVALFDGELDHLLRKKTGLWVELRPMRGDGKGPTVAAVQVGQGIRFQVGGEEVTPAAEGEASAASDTSEAEPEVTAAEREAAQRLQAEKDAFFAAQNGKSWLDRRRVVWPEVHGPLFDLATGEIAGRGLVAPVEGTFARIAQILFAGNAEFRSALWIGLISVAGTLLTVYAVAFLVASFLSFGLSRAVNQLSKATAAVQAGDFSYRIPAHRRDQVGALQRSFNEMANHLGEAVARAAEQEVLDKELAIAREVQRSLLPRHLPRNPKADCATLFEPSAALGGDYLDLIELSDGRLAVVIADVSGHGLSSGLRMAMVKAGLTLLLAERVDPLWILTRLDELIRQSSTERRFFVTATIALIDFRNGVVELTNAGHPPTYLLRGGEVEEIILESSPLGCLDRSFRATRFEIKPGDSLVWLSDGLIEAQSPNGEMFGYDRVAATLARPARTAADVRSALTGAIDAHAAGTPVGDDRTLVVVRYRPAATTAPARPEASASSAASPR